MQSNPLQEMKVFDTCLCASGCTGCLLCQKAGATSNASFLIMDRPLVPWKAVDAHQAQPGQCAPGAGPWLEQTCARKQAGRPLRRYCALQLTALQHRPHSACLHRGLFDRTHTAVPALQPKGCQDSKHCSCSALTRHACRNKAPTNAQPVPCEVAVACL